MRSLSVLLLCAATLGCKKQDGISRELGAACRDQTDCDGRCLPDPRWPGGFCSLSCSATDDCPVGSDCAHTGDGDVCLFLCFDDRDCNFLEEEAGMEWSCQTLTGPGAQTLVCAPRGGAG